eukprot:UN32299
MVSAASYLDNPWSVIMNLSYEGGIALADALVDRVQSNRPVTLVGYSCGARLILECLTELKNLADKAQEKKDFKQVELITGLVENVYLFGVPKASNSKSFKIARSMVAGRLVNAYSKSDWVLKILYRTTHLNMSIAGLEPVT